MRLILVASLIASIIYALSVALPVVLLPYDLINDYDGNHLVGAMHILNGDFGALYRPPDDRGFLVTSYPPLHIFVLAGMIRIFGLSVTYPRVLALISFLATVFITYRMTAASRGRSAALGAATLAFWISISLGGFHLGSVDHPMIVLATLTLYLTHAAQTRNGAVVAGLAAAGACLMKHTAIFTVLACALFFLIQQRKLVFPFLLAWSLAAGVPTAVFNHASDGFLLFHLIVILGSLPILDYWKFWYEIKALFASAGFAMLVGVYFGVPPRTRLDLLCLLTVLLWVGGVAPMLFKDGTSIGYLMPVASPAAVLFVSALIKLRLRKKFFVMTICLLSLVPLMTSALNRSEGLVGPYAEDGQKLAVAIERCPGRVLLDRHKGFLLAAGQVPEYDFKLIWWLEQRAGMTVSEGLIRDLNNGRYECVIASNGYITANVRKALDARYVQDSAFAIRSSPGAPYPYEFLLWRRRDL